jgi:cytidine deaminase
VTTSIPWRELVAAASAARDAAYAPYSRYQVGAALLSPSGRIYAACNVENASFGLTTCAERNAVSALVAAGEREMVALAVVTQGPEPGAPCGICRQTLAEFAKDLPIALASAGDTEPRSLTSLAELFPHPFRSDLVR